VKEQCPLEEENHRDEEIGISQLQPLKGDNNEAGEALVDLTKRTTLKRGKTVGRKKKAMGRLSCQC